MHRPTLRILTTLLIPGGLFQSCQNEQPAAVPIAPQTEVHVFAEMKTVDTQNGALQATFDRIEFLWGNDAINAARKTGDAIGDVDAKGDTTWWVANDYYILNPDTTVQTLPIAPDATVQLIDLEKDGGSGPRTATLAELPGNEQLHYFPFELTIRAGKIVALRAQFVP